MGTHLSSADVILKSMKGVSKLSDTNDPGRSASWRHGKLPIQVYAKRMRRSPTTARSEPWGVYSDPRRLSKVVSFS